MIDGKGYLRKHEHATRYSAAVLNDLMLELGRCGEPQKNPVAEWRGVGRSPRRFAIPGSSLDL